MVGNKGLKEGVDKGPQAGGISWKLIEDGKFSVKSAHDVECMYEKLVDHAEWAAVWKLKDHKDLIICYGSFT